MNRKERRARAKRDRQQRKKLVKGLVPEWLDEWLRLEWVTYNPRKKTYKLTELGKRVTSEGVNYGG